MNATNTNANNVEKNKMRIYVNQNNTSLVFRRDAYDVAAALTDASVKNRLSV